MGVNIKMLAERLQLSISTVSRALRDSYEISETTKNRVRDMALELNYQANPYASSLRKHRSKTVAVVIPEITNNFFSLAINGIEYVAQEKNYHVLIYLTHENIQKEIGFANHLQSGRVDGVLMSLSAETNNYDHLINLKSKGVPIVLFDRVCEAIESSIITTDDYDSGFAATEHLIECGCEKIAYLDLSRYLSISNKRMQGYQDALKKHNIIPDEELIIRFTNNNAANEEIITQMLSGPNRPDGIFASVEKLAISCYNVCERLHIKIPDQLKIISFSNMEISSLLNPSLSTITQPAYEIGKQAALQLFRYLEKKSMTDVHERIILKSTLIPRGSTGL
ncbi:MAG TPA: LacI family DNA-binding transcriptional regulator [Chitinophagaceae bacterium]|jgi:LacI family transcriptional regulator|nr:LacI family DNA-binding transcriptional regulator [Chitinophagaceae bacterium]